MLLRTRILSRWSLSGLGALGLFLLLAPSRALTRRLVVRNLQSRIVVRATGAERARPAYDVDSTASDVGQPKLRR